MLGIFNIRVPAGLGLSETQTESNRELPKLLRNDVRDDMWLINQHRPHIGWCCGAAHVTPLEVQPFTHWLLPKRVWRRVLSRT